jgi:hypothetical protein
LALALEELGQLGPAHAAAARALALPLPPALAKAVRACARRLEAARRADNALLAASGDAAQSLASGGVLGCG